VRHILKAAIAASVISCASASAQDASITLTGEYVSEYVFRGVTFAGQAFQPSAEASYGKFTAGVWASIALGEESEVFADEVDFYASLGWDLSESVSGELGGILYHFPQLGGVFDIGEDEAGTVEVYGALDFDVLLSPSLAAYYDIHLDTLTLEASTKYGVEITDDVLFEVSLDGGLVEANEGLNYQYGKLSGTTFYDLLDYVTIYGSFNYGVSSKDTFADISFNLSDPATLSDPTDKSTWFKVGLTTTF